MADSNALASIPIGVDPQEYYKAVRRQQIAQALTQNALTPLQAPEGGRQFARIGPMEGLSKIVSALAGRRMMDNSNKEMSDIYGKALQALSPNASGGAGASTAPASTSGTDNTGSPSAQTSSAPPNPLNPGGLPAAALLRMGPDDFAKYLQGTPEWQNAMRATGGNASAAAALLKAKMTKDATLELRPNGTAIGPDGRTIQAGNEYGQYATLDDGRRIFIPTQGVNQDVAQRAGLTEATKAANTLQTVPNQSGGTNVGYLGDRGLPALPPILQQRPNYFPFPQQSGQPAAGGAAPNTAQAPSATPPQAAGGAPASPSPSPNGAAPGARPDYWDGAQRYAPSTAIGGQSTGGKKDAEHYSDVKQDTFDEVGKRSSEAQEKSLNNFLAIDHLKNATTGQGQEQLNYYRSLLTQAGWLSKDQAAKLSDSEMLNKYLTRNATEGIREKYGRVTMGEVNLSVSKQAPSMEMQRRSILSLTIADELHNAYERQMAKDYDQYEKGGYDVRRFKSWYADKHPEADFVSQHADAVTASVLQHYNGGTHTLPTPDSAQGGGGRTVVRTGTHEGKRVVQYSDGSTEYAK